MKLFDKMSPSQNPKRFPTHSFVCVINKEANFDKAYPDKIHFIPNEGNFFFIFITNKCKHPVSPLDIILLIRIR